MLKIGLVRKQKLIKEEYIYPYETLIIDVTPALFLELADNEFADWHVSLLSFTTYFKQEDLNKLFGLEWPDLSVGSFKFEWKHKLFDNFLQFEVKNAYRPRIETHVWWSSSSGPSPEKGLEFLEKMLEVAYKKDNCVRKAVEKCIERRADLLYFS